MRSWYTTVRKTVWVLSQLFEFVQVCLSPSWRCFFRLLFWANGCLGGVMWWCGCSLRSLRTSRRNHSISVVYPLSPPPKSSNHNLSLRPRLTHTPNRNPAPPNRTRNLSLLRLHCRLHHQRHHLLALRLRTHPAQGARHKRDWGKS